MHIYSIAFLILKNRTNQKSQPTKDGNLAKNLLMTDLELREVMCMFYAFRQQSKQNKKITSPVCPITWDTFRIICKMEKTSVVNTTYNAQLFKTELIQIISGHDYYKAGSRIILHFRITSAQSLGKLQPELPLSLACLGRALSLQVILSSAQVPPPSVREAGLRNTQ